ncbi:snaclec B1-like [Patiria miniata]|uniref:C-type lectin domain-containing protein n=1 Tax=Patiria miniata TaxID=46514 RepID=A0A914AJ47_PATMI|nr:snaclec B1-like [Patiria miniata]
MAGRCEFLMTFALGVAVFSTGVGACPSGWKQWNQACYGFFQEPMSWTEADNFCQDRGSSLVVPHSRAENDFVWQMVVKRSAPRVMPERGLWLGCYRVSTDGELVCSGGTEELKFYNWAPGHPKMNGYKQCVRFLIMEGS